eukprot:TRINITY_DN6293_c0_g1_i1.p1 TRINITY_DN6293_c0_g1~~TRINITY_DN6293_c0_g1_i1.p1  ORF type:complete len:67 (-),score=5.57 TRINITY_DN6293_c0_g1_i1:191-391(-)
MRLRKDFQLQLLRKTHFHKRNSIPDTFNTDVALCKIYNENSSDILNKSTDSFFIMSSNFHEKSNLG